MPHLEVVLQRGNGGRGLGVAKHQRLIEGFEDLGTRAHDVGVEQALYQLLGPHVLGRVADVVAVGERDGFWGG